MNILFVYTSEIIAENGGVQRVTKVLADYFEKNQLNVFYLIKLKSSKNNYKNHYFLPDDQYNNSQVNLNYIRTLVIEKKINIIINQAALGGTMASLCYEAKKVADVKILSVIHNSLLGNLDNFTSSNKKIFNVIPVSLFSTFLELNFFKKILLTLYVFKYKKKYNRLYDLSDRIILLSDTYFSQFKLFVNNATKEKVLSIYNPCSFNKNTSNIKKENELLFVGRINITQKRVDILLKIWKELFVKFPDWKLNVVGNGPDLDYLKERVNKMNLERVFFVGHQDPESYYKRAKIFCMTSSYEGLPLVLSEAQNYNVFPVLFNSFPSANDIIKNNINGILIKPFDIKSYIKNLENLMLNYEEKSKTFNLELQNNVNRFSINTIGNQWLNLFKKLLDEY
jgi:glycosyltransferase involved in cell wall biosynthesis